MAVTSKDLAAHLGLSQSTVSRVLSGAADSRVSPATRERVLAAASALGYRANAVARSLRSGRTGVVGLYTRHNYDARDEFFGAILGGLQRACSKRQLDLLLFNGEDGRPAEAVAAKLLDGRVDGLLVHSGDDDPIVARLLEARLPAVALADPLSGLPAVNCDDDGGTRLLVAHLRARGYERLAYLAPDRPLASVERRVATFEALAAGRVLRLPFGHEEGLLPAVAAVLAEPDTRPLAVCCWNDHTAYALLRAALAAGVAVPERLAVAGFDGFLDAKLPARDLVTVLCPWDLVAEVALARLSRWLEGEPQTGDEVLGVSLSLGDTA